MTSFQITDLKTFMNKLLATDLFDSFLLAEALITTYNTFIIDGHTVTEFFAADEDGVKPQAFSLWKDMRSLCFDLIKGKRTPVSFKFILHLNDTQIASVLSKGDTNVTPHDVKAFVFTVKYDGSVLTCITGTAFHTFFMDKTPDALWDDAIRKFLARAGISYEEL